MKRGRYGCGGRGNGGGKCVKKGLKVGFGSGGVMGVVVVGVGLFEICLW